MELKINLDYNRTPEQIEEISNSSLTNDYVSFAIRTMYEKGLTGSQRRMFGRIQRKFDKSIEENKDYVELDISEFEFIRLAITNDKVLFPSDVSKYVVILEDEIEQLKDSEKE